MTLAFQANSPGSNPGRCTLLVFFGCAFSKDSWSSGMMSPSHGEGQEFESPRIHGFSAIIDSYSVLKLKKS